MKKIWNMLRGRSRRDNRGLSFVEVLCAVAILALVAGVIGTVIVVSTRTYRKGISETGIQQEAQLAANNIGNIVKNACSVVYGESGQQYLENGEDLMVKSDTTPKMQVDGTTELSIITNEKIQYTVTYQRTNPSEPRGRLFYQEFDSETGNAISDMQIMASNIVDFSADTTDFKESKTIKLKMTVEDETTNRRIPMEYTMTSRNDAVEGAVYVSHTDNVSILFPENDVVLVPGETYQIPLVVAGQLTEGGLEWESVSGGVTAGGLTLDYAEVTVPIETTEETGTIVVHTKDKDELGNYKATASCNILIRRVQGVQVSHTTDTTNSQGGMFETAGTVYTFTASVTGHELVKHVAYDYDRNYKTAQAVAWSCVLKVNGTEKQYDWTCTKNAESGKWEYTAPVFSTGVFDQYFELDTAATKEDALVPSFKVKLKETMPADFEFTVRATSKHALGVNKADSKYYDGLGFDPVDIYYGEDTLKPRETIITPVDIIIEPLDTGTVKLDTKGGRPAENDVEFVYSLKPFVNGETTEEYVPAEGTTAKYLLADDTVPYDRVEITLGKDEKGGYDRDDVEGAIPYTFYIGVKVKSKGTLTTIITVHVRRVDYVHIDAIRNKDDNTTMDLRLRFNADSKVDNLIQYLTDGTDKGEDGQPLAYKALSTRVTIEVLDKENNVNESLTQIAEWGTYEGAERDKTKETNDVIKIIKGEWNKQLKTKDANGKEKVVYQIENTKPARILSNGSSWSLAQTPELDIKPMSLGVGEKIKVTMEAMHPIGTNNTGMTYRTEVKDIKILDGEEIISVAKKDEEIIVEPYQVSDSNSSGPMAIPLYTAPQVGGIKVKLEGQDTNTRVVNENASSDTNSEWVLPISGSNPTNLLLNISRTEEGSTFEGKDGRIKMTLTAYSESAADKMTDDTLLDTIPVYLAVRRVTTVEIKDKKAFVNEIGKTIELKALASGLQGTDYFDRQVKDSDDKYEPVWDSADKYKSPYKLKWSLYYKDNKGTVIEKEISNSYSEYFKDVSYDSEKTDGSGAQAIKFTLTKALPVGAQIRATSVHAGNKDGKAENRSGLNYVKDIDKYKKNYPEGIVFDYIEVGNSQIVSGWKRGGLYNIASLIPEKYVKTEYNADGTIKSQWLVDDDGNPIPGNDTNSLFKFTSKYPVSYFSDINHQSRSQDFGSNTREDSLINFVGDSNALVDYQAQLVTEPAERAKIYSYSSPYPNPGGWYWLDLSQVYVKVNVGGGSWIDTPNTLAVVEEYYDVEDVVFQYRNSLPETSKQSGDSDGAWSSKSNNTTIVYVTADDTIGSYDSYYKLSEGWEETYEKYTLLPERYVGVINDSKTDDSLDKRLTDFTVSNTTGTGNEEGRSYVSFTFSKDVKKKYTGEIVKMIYEYNPFLCQDASGLIGTGYGQFSQSQIDEVDGCDGILEFHFVDANINVKSGVTMPEVRYCPTYSENKSSATPNYYYISTSSRFYINSDGKTAQYQTGGVGKWTTKYSMTYANGKWTIQ